MDALAWSIVALAGTATVLLAALAPRLKRDNLRRQIEGGGGMGGIGAGFDAVWRPSAEDANAQWQAAVELPAPAPTPGDKGPLDEGRIVIDVPSDH